MTPSDADGSPVALPPGVAATYRPADFYGFVLSGRVRLRYARWNVPATARGTVVLVQGRAEFIEKYAMEVVGEFLARGFSVCAMDLRGQGLSDRLLPDHDKGHIDDFATYVSDLKLVVDTIVAEGAPKPLLLVCHSTGGNIGLRYLANQSPGPFSAAVFTSPMTGLPRAGLVRALLAVFGLFPGLDTRYAPGTGPYHRVSQDFATNDVTHDERRFRFTEQWFDSDPRLRLGGPTIGWVRQAFRSFDVLNARGTLERIDLPLLVLSASADTVVDASTHAAVVSRIKIAKHLVIHGARHEIMMERDPLRAQFWQAFDRLAAEFGR